jgi:hypothetical protein
MDIPRPPKRKLLEKLVPRKKFFKDLSIPAIVRRERMEAGQSRLPKGIIGGIIGLVVLFVAGFTVSFFIAKHKVANSIASRESILQAGIQDLQNLDTQDAQEKFSSLNGNISGLSSAFQRFGSFLSGSAGAIGTFSDLTKQLALLSQQIDALKSDSFDFLGGGESNLVSNLSAVRGTLAAIDADTNQLSSAASFMGSNSPLAGDDYASLKTQLAGAEKFLDAFVPWLATSTPHHVLIFLQNPSEIRPAGGFLGSYADVTLANGTITDISVYDIADADAAFAQKIVPPKPLQLEVTRWRPADANWFFDFPTSASKTIWFFENAQFPCPMSLVTCPISYDGTVAVSPKIVSDLLSVTGPLKLPDFPVAFNANNFLVQIQNLVQQGQAQSATYPKQVLRDLADAIFQKLASSTNEERQNLLGMSLDWMNKKEVMAYFKDSDFENFLMNYGAAGEVYGLPQKFNGDYLAVVDANINGQKSDLYVSSTIAWVAQIGEDGMITNELSVTRKHNGNTSPYWWYRAPNQDYLQVFVTDGSVLTNENGGVKKIITPPINYARSGYSTDPLVAAIESSTLPYFTYPAVTTREESGKVVFATWAKVSAGQSTNVSFSYTHHLFIAPTPGMEYQFIFEKQAGTNRHYSFEIDAPLGYVFAENGIASWTYQSDDPPGRMIVNLTLQKI